MLLLFLGLLACFIFFASCQKEDILNDEFSSNSKAAAELSAFLAGAQGQEGHSDGHHHPHPTPIEISELPTTITDYMNTNYLDANIAHAGVTSNGNYVIIIQNTDGTKVGLLFDAAGNFLQVLPSPPNCGGGNGHHAPHSTPVDVSTLPANITDYVTADYSGYSIDRAGLLINGNYIVVVESSDGSKVRLLFDAEGNFLQLLPAPHHG